MPRIDPDLSVAELLRREPWALDVLLSLGFKPLENPVTRKVMAHLVTLHQACERNDRTLDEVLDALRAAAPPVSPSAAIEAAPEAAFEMAFEGTAAPETETAPEEADR